MDIVLGGSNFVRRFRHFLRFMSIGFVLGFLSQMVNESMHHRFGWFLVSIVGPLVAVHLPVLFTCSRTEERETWFFFGHCGLYGFNFVSKLLSYDSMSNVASCIGRFSSFVKQAVCQLDDFDMVLY